MRKLGRILRTCLTALSLLLFLSILAAWMRSYWCCDVIRVRHLVYDDLGWQSKTRLIGGSRGQLLLAGDHAMANASRTQEGQTMSAPTDLFARGKRWICDWPIRRKPESSDFSPMHFGFQGAQFIGVRFYRDTHRGTVMPDFLQENVAIPDAFEDSRLLVVPDWLAAIVFGALPAWRIAVNWRQKRRRRRATQPGQCPRCGYDLRASPNRCPECGLPVEPRVAQASRP